MGEGDDGSSSLLVVTPVVGEGGKNCGVLSEDNSGSSTSTRSYGHITIAVKKKKTTVATGGR